MARPRQIKLEILCEWRPIIFDGFAFIFALVGDLIRIFPEAECLSPCRLDAE